ncbi:MAG: tyrosine-type recombinase/integrase [Anaerovoracaceae bacterium]
MFIEEFTKYLKEVKSTSPSSIEAYQRDIKSYLNFLHKKDQSASILNTTNTDIVSFLLAEKSDGKSAATINRKKAALRAYFNFLTEIGQAENNPVTGIKSPKVERMEIEFLSIDEVEDLIKIPDDSKKGIRDRAIIELLYATGIRANELISANVEDVNIKIGFFMCNNKSGKPRIIPMGKPAIKAMKDYLDNSRNLLLKDGEKEVALFVNHFGKRITRQGLWKILREYGDISGQEKKITPHILRNSFAVHMIQNGADLKAIQEMMGHEDIAATQVYILSKKNRIKDVYDNTHPRA